MYLKKKLAQPENFLIRRGFNLVQPEKNVESSKIKKHLGSTKLL